MDLDQINFNIKAYKEHNQILDAANFVVHQFGLENKDFEGFGFREEIEINSILLTTEGEFGGAQRIIIPRNLFDFDLALVMNVIAHEMVHVSQRAAKDFVEDKNEENGRLILKCFFISAFLSYRNFPTFIKNSLQTKLTYITAEWVKALNFNRNMLMKKQKLMPI